jgi:hypothetical protein
VNAVNDAWAGSPESTVPPGGGTGEPLHLYRLTDGEPPLAPAGDDNEQRPLVFQPEPTLFVLAPPVVVPPPPPPTTVQQTAKPTKKRAKLLPAVYRIQKPVLQRMPDGTFLLKLSFRVRRKVRIGLEGLRGGRVVSKSAVKTFTGKAGTLVLRLNPRDWPTKLKFILPK